MKRLHYVTALLLVALLAGCADQINSLNSSLTQAVSSLQANVTAPPTNDAFATSGLPNLFMSHSLESGWPRVALTIDDMPSDANQPVALWYDSRGAGYVAPAGYCIIVSAVVWTSPKQSREIHGVPFCGRDIPSGQTGTTIDKILFWATMPKADVKNTGARRTTGPTPPLKSFPTHGLVSEVANSRATFMFTHLLMSMGIDVSEDPIHEYRAWVVSTVR